MTGIKQNDIAKVTGSGSCLIKSISAYLRSNDVKLDIETILNNLCEPTDLSSLIVGCFIVDIDNDCLI